MRLWENKSVLLSIVLESASSFCSTPTRASVRSASTTAFRSCKAPTQFIWLAQTVTLDLFQSSCRCLQMKDNWLRCVWFSVKWSHIPGNVSVWCLTGAVLYQGRTKVAVANLPSSGFTDQRSKVIQWGHCSQYFPHQPRSEFLTFLCAVSIESTKYCSWYIYCNKGFIKQ